MKTSLKNILLSTLFVFALQNVIGQSFDNFVSPIKPIDQAEFIVYYDVTYTNDSTQIDRKGNTDAMLVLGKNMSQYMDENKFLYDSIVRSFKSFEEYQAYLLDRTRFLMYKLKYEIYKNYPQGKISYYESVGSGNNITYQEPLNLFDWNITSDTATMFGYKAQKATTSFGGRDWVAWFTPEIPYSDGPYKFRGLPGLIIDLRDTKDHYIFEISHTRKPNKDFMINIKDKEYRLIDKKQYNLIKKHARESFINAHKANIKDKKTLERLNNKKRIDKNNPIELSE